MATLRPRILRYTLTILATAAFVIATVTHVTQAADPIDAWSNGRVMFLGDSITNGGQYVSYIEYYLQKTYPARKFDIVSIGLSSETASGLSEKTHPFPRPCIHTRLKQALVTVKPDIVVACYGMNDGIYHPQSDERMQAFRDGIGKLVSEVKASGAEIWILTPPPFDPVPVRGRLVELDAPDFSYRTPYVDYHTVLEDYSEWLLTMKNPDVAGVVDLNRPMTNYLALQRKSNPDYRFGGDGIHPNPAGHLMMAARLLDAIGVQTDLDTQTDYAAKSAAIANDRLFKLVDRRRSLRSGGWLKYVGYTRGKTYKIESIEPTETEATKLQLEIDAMRKK